MAARATPAATPAAEPPPATSPPPPASPPPSLTPPPPTQTVAQADPPAKPKKKLTGFEAELSILAQIRRRLDSLPTAKAKARCVEMLTEYFVESQGTKPPAGE